MIFGAWDINIIAKRNAAKLSGDEVDSSLAQLFEGIHRHADKGL